MVEGVKGDCQLSKKLGSLAVHAHFFQAPNRAPESISQRDMFIGIPQSSEQAPDLFGALMGSANGAKGLGSPHFPFLHAFEQQALKGTAVFRAIGVYAALPSVVAPAGLAKFRSSGRAIPF